MTAGPHRDQSAGAPTGRLGAWRGLWGLLGLVLVVAGPAAGQPVRIDTYVSADSVRIGERFTVSFVAAHAGDVEVSFPDPATGADAFGAVEVIGRRGTASRTGRGGQRIDSVAYEVTTFALDSVRVPAVPVQVVAGGDTSLARTPPRTARVISVIGPASRGIHSVAPLASFPRPWWAWALAALVATALLAGLAYLWWRRQRPDESLPAPPSPKMEQTPYEAATSWIRQLESYDLSDPAAVKPFYVELSNALRVYLAHEMNVAALERTTREVMEELERRRDVPDDAAARLRAVLELADLVKFADMRPSADDHEKAIREARAALDTLETTPSAPEAVDGVASAG